MTEITNKQRGPVSLLIRSRSGRRVQEFTTLTIPGIGAGKNVVTIDDEVVTDHVERARRDGLVSVRVLNK